MDGRGTGMEERHWEVLRTRPRALREHPGIVILLESFRTCPDGRLGPGIDKLMRHQRGSVTLPFLSGPYTAA